MKCNEVNGSCKCGNSNEVLNKLNNIEEQIKVLTEEYDVLNRFVYSDYKNDDEWS